MKWKNLFFSLKVTRLVIGMKTLQEYGMIRAIPGIYKRIFDEGNCRIVEKVIIRKASAIAEMYRVVRIRWKIDRLSNKGFNKEKIEKWIAAYDSSKRQLELVDGQGKCSFLPEKLILFFNNTKLKKIKSF